MPINKKQKIVKWLALAGNIRPTDSGFVYVPTPPDPSTPPTPSKEPSAYFSNALAKSDLFFSSGTIEFDVKLEDDKSMVQVVLNHGTPIWVYIGLNVPPNAYGVATTLNQFRTLNGTGMYGNFDVQRRYALRVEVSGKTVTLWVEGVQVCKADDVSVVNSQIAVYVGGNSPLEISDFRVNNLKAKVFVVMQFTPEYNALYDEVIKPVSEEFGFECVRGDDVYKQGLIIEDIAAISGKPPW